MSWHSPLTKSITNIWDLLLQNACKVMAKDLVRTRRYIQKFYQMKTQLQAVSLRIQVRFNTNGWQINRYLYVTYHN